MQQIQLELAGGGTLTVCLRASLDAMPTVKQRPLVLVVPGGGYSHVSFSHLETFLSNFCGF